MSARPTAPGASSPLAAVAHDGGVPAAVVDGDGVGPLVGEDEVVLPVAVEVGDRQGDPLLGAAVGPEGAVAVAEQDQDVAEVVADEQVGPAVGVDVGDAQAGGVAAGVDGEGRAEAAPAVAPPDGDAVGGQHGQVVEAVAVEVGGHDRAGLALDRQGGRVGEPVAQAGEDAERVRAAVERHQARRPPGGEPADRHARRCPPGTPGGSCPRPGPPRKGRARRGTERIGEVGRRPG